MPQYADGITLITCTGGRPKVFARCCTLVQRQTYIGRYQWLIVDDVSQASGPSRSELATMVFPKPKWQPGQNTLARNLLAAIPEVRYSKVIFAEDDDWYATDYVAKMAALLDGPADIVGDPNSLYYHLPSKRYRVMKNGPSASLCQTGIKASMLPALERVCQGGSQFIDYRLWQQAKTKMLTHVGGVVGIKGLPGRPGIGVGHHPERDPKQWTDDADLAVLRKWIGDDVQLYQEWL